MILSGPFVSLIRFIRDIVDGVGAIYPHASLDATADFLAEHSGHVLFVVQVLFVLMNVIETVNTLACKVRNCRAKFLIFRLGRFIISCADGIETIHL